MKKKIRRRKIKKVWNKSNEKQISAKFMTFISGSIFEYATYARTWMRYICSTFAPHSPICAQTYSHKQHERVYACDLFDLNWIAHSCHITIHWYCLHNLWKCKFVCVWHKLAKEEKKNLYHSHEWMSKFTQRFFWSSVIYQAILELGYNNRKGKHTSDSVLFACPTQILTFHIAWDVVWKG